MHMRTCTHMCHVYICVYAPPWYPLPISTSSAVCVQINKYVNICHMHMHTCMHMCLLPHHDISTFGAVCIYINKYVDTSHAYANMYTHVSTAPPWYPLPISTSGAVCIYINKYIQCLSYVYMYAYTSTILPW